MPGRAAAATAACSPRLPAADARCPRRHMCVCTRSQTHTHTHACAQFGAHMYISHKRMHTAHAAPAGRPRCGARVLWVATARNLQAVAGGRHDAPQAVLGGAGLRGRLLGQLLRPHPRCRGGPDAVGGRRRRMRGGPVRGVLAELEVRRHGRGSASEERRCPSASAESRTAGDACCGTHASAIFRSCSKAKATLAGRGGAKGLRHRGHHVFGLPREEELAYDQPQQPGESMAQAAGAGAREEAGRDAPEAAQGGARDGGDARGERPAPADGRPARRARAPRAPREGVS